MTRTRWLLAVLALAALPGLVGALSPHDLEVHDQARQALYVVDARNGSWLVPRDRGMVATKPPLYTWLAALGSIALGQNETSVCLPSLLASFGLGLLVFDLGRRLYGGEVGLVALALFATLGHVVKLSFLARTDMLLAFWIALAMWAAWRGSALLFWVSVGLGALTKGPVGFVVPPLALAFEALARRDGARWRALRPRLGASLAVAIVAAWLIPALWVAGDELWRVTIRVELIDRLSGSGTRATAHHHPFWYLLPQVFVTLAPASLLLPYALARRPRGAAEAARPFLASWILAVLVVVSLPASKRPDYLIPLHAPALLLASAALVAWRRGALPGRAARWIGGATRAWAGAAGGAAAGVALAILTGVFASQADPPGWVLALGLAGIVPLASVARGRSGRGERLAHALVAQALAVLVWSNVWAAPARVGDAPALRRFAREVAETTRGQPVEFHEPLSRSIQFLLHRNVPELDVAQLVERAEAPDPSWVILSGRRYGELAADAHLFARLGAPQPVLRSAPRPRRGGDPLVLIRIGGTRADPGPDVPSGPPASGRPRAVLAVGVRLRENPGYPPEPEPRESHMDGLVPLALFVAGAAAGGVATWLFHRAILRHERETAKRALAHFEETEQRLREAFQALSAEALRHSNHSFLDLARSSLAQFHQEASHDLESREKAIRELVTPLRESLHQVDAKLTVVEKERREHYGRLTEQLRFVATAHEKLQSETQNLAKALRAPTVRGRWGEIQLKRVVELAGMVEHCDFFEQETGGSPDSRLRPDLLVRLPGGKNVVVDAKAPLEAYLASVEANDEGERVQRLGEHARQVRQHMMRLGGKNYQDQFEPTPEFVVMFLPGETFFSAALEQDPTLIEFGVEHGVIPASPTTLIALLRAVAYGWRQERIARNAQEISELGRELYTRVSRLATYFGRVGNGLERALQAYNEAVGCLESRVLVQARRFQELGAAPGGDGIPELASVERSARALRAPELEADSSVDPSG